MTTHSPMFLNKRWDGYHVENIYYMHDGIVETADGLKHLSDLTDGAIDYFEGSFILTQAPQVWKADVKLRAGRVALPPLAQAPPPDDTQFVTDTKLPVAEESAWPLPPVEVRADVVIDSLDAPYIYEFSGGFNRRYAGFKNYARHLAAGYGKRGN